MSQKQIEISLNIIVLILTVAINLGAVIWVIAEMRTEVDHIHAQVQSNSDKIEKISEILLTGKKEK